MKIYLAGGINGLSDSQCRDWREYVKSRVSNTIDPMRRDYRGVEDQNVAKIVEDDLEDIRACDVVLAMCSRASWGTAMEIRYAWQICRPVYVVVDDLDKVSPWLRYHAAKLFSSVEVATSCLLSDYP